MKRSEREYARNRKRDDECQNYYYKSNGEALPPPIISLSVNNNCYMRCKMCDIGAANSKRIEDLKQRHMSDRYLKYKRYTEFPLERLKTLVDEMAPYDTIIRTNFIEPMLYRKFRELVTYVKEKDLRFYTITNGWTLRKHAEWAVDAQIDVLRVSIDGTPDVHDNIRGMKGSFERAMTGLKMAVERKKQLGTELPVLGICYTVSDHNYWNLVPFMEMLRDDGILEHIYVNFSHLQFASDWEVKKTIEADPEMFADLKECSTVGVDPVNVDVHVLQDQIDTLSRKFPRDTYHYYFDPVLEGDNLVQYYDNETWMFKDAPCFLPWYIAQIDVNGDLTVRGHCVLPPFGNIMERDFFDVWNSPRAKEIRNRMKTKGAVAACNKCIGTLYALRGRG